MRCEWERHGEGVRCWHCGARQSRPTKRICHPMGTLYSGQACAYGQILREAPPTADPAAYVTRLDRCRSADCGLLHLVDGVVKCIGRGRSCEWLGEWARFLAGSDDCPHWPTKSPADHQ